MWLLPGINSTVLLIYFLNVFIENNPLRKATMLLIFLPTKSGHAPKQLFLENHKNIFWGTFVVCFNYKMWENLKLTSSVNRRKIFLNLEGKVNLFFTIIIVLYHINIWKIMNFGEESYKMECHFNNGLRTLKMF